MPTTDMQRVQELVKESAQRITEQEGVNLAATARLDGLPGDDLLTVTVAVGDDSVEEWREFSLPGSVLRVDEASLVRLLNSHLEYIAWHYRY